ncbi:hypothetical protein MMC14_006873 [Varicellaria rhodocarpa]|nr:hypothetical protein [Varicellaria rhodocarpa]
MATSGDGFGTSGILTTGTLSPQEATTAIYETGLHHLYEPTQLMFIKNVYGGLLVGFGGVLSQIASKGSPGLLASNPGLVKLLQGATFPVSLICAYTVGAEFVTAYPMWLVMTGFERKGRPIQYIRALVVAWLGNIVGALFSAFVFSYSTGVLTIEPYRSGIVEQITMNIVDAAWHIIFIRAIGCGFLITLSMFLGTQFRDGISKAIGLHLPFFVSIVAAFPHTVEIMYDASLGMMLGAPLSVPAFFYKCLAPITLGNFVGGAVFTGFYFWYVNLYCEDGAATRDWFENLWMLGTKGDIDGDEV